MVSQDDFPSTVSVTTLDRVHYAAFRMALLNTLATPLAEFTMAELIDGLPTADTILDCRGIRNMGGHPIKSHKKLCDGALERTRQFRSAFDPSALSLKASSIYSFQNCDPESHEFDLRLLELLAEAIHLIAVFLFELKKKFHKGDIESVVSYRQPDQAVEYIPGEWMTLYNEEQPYPTLFTFSHYNCPEQYPHGLADVAAYWAEDRIFGGVLLFDRGESGQECKDVYLHSNRLDWTMRVWSLLDSQFRDLMDFLKNESPVDVSPFPLCADEDNVHRFDTYDAMKWHNIYRDRWERKLPDRKNWSGIRHNTFDYPELKALFRAVADTNYVPVSLSDQDMGRREPLREGSGTDSKTTQDDPVEN